MHNGNSGNPSVWPLPQDGQQFANIGNQSSVTLSQTVTITNDGVYRLRWFDSSGHSGGFTTSPYSVTLLTGAVQTVVSTNLDAYHSTFGDWERRSIEMTLGLGTHTIRFRAEGVQSGLDTLIEDVRLERLPDADLVTSIHVSAVDICWAGRTNQMYQVQYSTNLSSTDWFDLGSPVAGAGANCVTDVVTPTERFYRIVRLP
jgi:hypothetical protein